MVNQERPNPGSNEARDQGCTCPVLDNGRGVRFLVDGERQFWTHSDCPLHGFHAPKKEDTMSEERDIVEQVRLIKLSGSLAPFAIDKLEEAASEITRLRGEVERLRGALTCIAGYEDMTAFEWERKFPVANIIMAPLDPSKVSEGLCEIARSALNLQGE